MDNWSLATVRKVLKKECRCFAHQGLSSVLLKKQASPLPILHEQNGSLWVYQTSQQFAKANHCQPHA